MTDPRITKEMIEMLAKRMADTASDWIHNDCGDDEHGLEHSNWEAYTEDAKHALEAVTAENADLSAKYLACLVMRDDSNYERDSLAAVIERAEAANSAPHENTKQSNSRMTAVSTALAGSPREALAERDARVLEAGRAKVAELMANPLLFTTPAIQGVVAALSLLDAEAARIREGGNRG